MTILEKARPKLPRARKPKKSRDPNRAKFLAQLRARMTWFDVLEVDSRRANCPRWRKRLARFVIGGIEMCIGVGIYIFGIGLGMLWCVAGLPFSLWRKYDYLRDLWSE